jgi:hypothetical protein
MSIHTENCVLVCLSLQMMYEDRKLVWFFFRVPLLVQFYTMVITLMSLSARCPASRTVCHLLTSSLCWPATSLSLLCCLSGEHQ